MGIDAQAISAALMEALEERYDLPTDARALLGLVLDDVVDVAAFSAARQSLPQDDDILPSGTPAHAIGLLELA